MDENATWTFSVKEGIVSLSGVPLTGTDAAKSFELAWTPGVLQSEKDYRRWAQDW